MKVINLQIASGIQDLTLDLLTNYNIIFTDIKTEETDEFTVNYLILK